MNKTISQIYGVKKPDVLNDDKVRALREAFGFWENQPKTVYSSKGSIFRDKTSGYVFNNSTELLKELYKIGVPTDFSLKEAGLLVEHWFENLTSAPEYTESTVTKTSLDKDESRSLINEAEQREAAINKTKENAKIEVERAQNRLKEIYDQQKLIQEQIAKAQALQTKIEGKKIYATVEQSVPVLKPEVAEAFETLVGYASYQETRTDLIDQLTEEIKTKTEADELFARTAAVQVVNDLANPEAARETLIEAAIQRAILDDKSGIVEQTLQKDGPVVENVKRSAALHESDLNNSIYLPKEIANKFLGKDIAEAEYGSGQIKVLLSSEKNDTTKYELNLGNSNQNYIKSLQEKEELIDSVIEFGSDKTKSVFTNNVQSYLTKQTTSLPEGNVLKKTYSRETVQKIFSNNGLPGKIEWKSYNISSTITKYFPESVPYFKLFGEVTGIPVGIGASSKIVPLTFGRGAVPLTKIAYIQPTKSLGAPYTLGIKTGTKFAVGKTAGQVAVQTGTKAGLSGLLAKGATALGVSLGVFTAGVSTVVTLAIAAVGKIINWPKVKQWFYENKEIFAITAGLGGLMIGGPVAGAVGLGLGILATGTLATFAAGTFGILGFIGRSIGITIATPVIITLLIIPPLVAFIMVVINNSAYVVPPSPLVIGSSQVIVSPYIDVIKTPNPPGPFENSDLPLTVDYTIEIKAKKGNLSNVTIEYDCKVIKKNGSAECPKNDPAVPSTVEGGISPTTPFTFSYKHTYNPLSYTDSFITDTITVTADVEGQTGVSAAGSATIKIGKPPEDCPSIWPTSHGSITQGAYTPASCGKNCSHGTTESIDIGVSNTGVVATHTGTVVLSERNSCYGNRVQIKSTCNGRDFISQYAHLEGISVKMGQLVTMGQNIGLSGNTGSCTTGAHLHYEFRYYPDGKPSWPNNPPFMNNPFIPENILRGCKTRAECGVSF